MPRVWVLSLRDWNRGLESAVHCSLAALFLQHHVRWLQLSQDFSQQYTSAILLKDKGMGHGTLPAHAQRMSLDQSRRDPRGGKKCSA
jgi:hypothetical protein